MRDDGQKKRRVSNCTFSFLPISSMASGGYNTYPCYYNSQMYYGTGKACQGRVYQGGEYRSGLGLRHNATCGPCQVSIIRVQEGKCTEFDTSDIRPVDALTYTTRTHSTVAIRRDMSWTRLSGKMTAQSLSAARVLHVISVR